MPLFKDKVNTLNFLFLECAVEILLAIECYITVR